VSAWKPKPTQIKMVLWLSSLKTLFVPFNLADYSIHTHRQRHRTRVHMWSKNLTSAHTKDRSSAIHKGSFVRQSKSAAGIERELLWRISGERCGRSARPVGALKNALIVPCAIKAGMFVLTLVRNCTFFYNLNTPS
jgi:hypothetical protein